MIVKDRVGREIKVGCSILYPVRRGSSMWHSELKIQQILPGDDKTKPYVSGFNNDGRRVYVHNLDMAVVIVPLGVQYEMAV